MTNDKVNEVLAFFVKHYRDAGYTPVRAESNNVFQNVAEKRRHRLWMAEEALKFPPEKVEKKMRWLGFIQGGAWCEDGMAIDVLKKQNMPDEEKTDA